MENDIKDIDQEVINKILEHADEFIGVDVRIDEIISWGETELDALEKEVTAYGGTIEDFKKKGEEIRQKVTEKLQAFEQELRAKYETLGTTP